MNLVRICSYFLLINPWNHSGKLPLWRIRGAWVSVNHFRASSLNLLSVFSPWTSPPHDLWSILTRSCVSPEGQRGQLSTPGKSVGPQQQSHLPMFQATSSNACGFLNTAIVLVYHANGETVWHWTHLTTSISCAFFSVSGFWGHVNFRRIWCISASHFHSPLLLRSYFNRWPLTARSV